MQKQYIGVKSKKGLIFINCALLAEANLLHICNNNVVLVTVDKETQKKRLFDRELTDEQIETRLACQYTQSFKRIEIQRAIERTGHGRIWEYDNSIDETGTITTQIAEIAREIME